ncbi:MAG: hypothetical protein LBV42_06095 [Methanobrevibacter sp.]|jgi:hypothetical protein|nr:hypothetical protein [Methanobrevibacter sp.]
MKGKTPWNKGKHIPNTWQKGISMSQEKKDIKSRKLFFRHHKLTVNP